MHDDNGRVTIPGFYDGVQELPADIKADLKALNLTPEEFLGQVGLKVPAGEKDRMLIEQISTRPTAEINGIIGGYTGEGAKTVIAGQAIGKMSFRLVGDAEPEEDPRRVPRFVRDAAARGLPRSSSSIPAAARRIHCRSTIRRSQGARGARREWGKKAVTVGRAARSRSSAISSACSAWTRCMVGFALDDDRVHSPNEKYDLTSFHKGTRSWARILAALAG